MYSIWGNKRSIVVYRVSLILLGAILLPLLCLLLLYSFASAGWNEPVFVTPYNEKTDVITLGDMNGDGALDIVAGNDNPSVIPELPSVIYLNSGEGSFVRGSEINGLVHALGDLNGDGTLDPLAFDDGKFIISLNDGTSNFSGVIEIAAPNYIGTPVVGDIDGDGSLDILYGELEPKIALYFNDGTGNFTRSAGITTTYSTRQAALGDFDGKNGLDIVTQEFYKLEPITVELPGGDTVSYQRPLYYINTYINDGSGGFTAVSTLDDPVSTADIALGDMNGDGALDIVVGNSDYLDTLYDDHSKVYLNKNDGTGTFLAGKALARLDYVTGVALGDVNSDGANDIVVSNSSEPSVVVYQNSGDGNFDDGTPLDGAFTPSDIAIGELNGDGALDVALGNNVVNIDAGGVGQPNVIYFNDGIGGFVQGLTLEHDPIVDNQLITKYSTRGMALGDLDNSDTLDIIEGNRNAPIAVFLNQGESNFEDPIDLIRPFEPFPVAIDPASRVIAGDVNGDRALDIIEVNFDGDSSGYVVLYLNANDESGNFTAGAFIDAGNGNTKTASAALGDVDNDGDLDLVAGNNGQPSRVYLNQGDGSFDAGPALLGLDKTRSITLGDINKDGALDVVAGNEGAPISVYINRNDGTANFDKVAELVGPLNTRSVALGDMNSDGVLDIVAGSRDQPVRIYFNDGLGVFTDTLSLITSDSTDDLALGDLNGDGRLDIVASDFDETFLVYLNDDDGVFHGGPVLNDLDRVVLATSVVLGDVNGDGTTDVITGHNASQSDYTEFPNTAVFLNMRQASNLLPGSSLAANLLANQPLHVAVKQPSLTDSSFLITTTIPITYTLFDGNVDPAGRIEVFYSPTGVGRWIPAVPTGDTKLTDLTTGPYPTANSSNTHVYTWDTFASQFFGQSDNVALRFVAYSQRAMAGEPGSYRYYDGVAGTYQWASSSTTTSPFRVRGTRVRVYGESVAAGNELANALVFRLPDGQETGGALMPDPDNPLRTNFQGYLPGAGELGIGDGLFAIWPITDTDLITFTDKFTLYHTSGPPTTEGLQFNEVEEPVIQELVVSSENQLLVLNLDLSLEWDARHDSGYLEQLELDLKRASEILFDLSNGQVALGRVRIFQNRERWVQSDVVIYARNDLRPNANLGGVVEEPISDKLKSGELIPAAMLPGQIRMGATWNRYGNAGGTIGEDWPRALAHEIGHYALFLLDNYLGVTADGLIVETDCAGSAMTDAYRQEYSEFLENDVINANGFGWRGDCLNTLAETTTGRADWETIHDFYPFLGKNNINSTGIGPIVLPLNLTQVELMPTAAPDNTLTDPLINVTIAGDSFDLPRGRAQGYLLKTQGTTTPGDDTLIPVGTPNGPLILARGAAPADRFCIFGQALDRTTLSGCLDSMTVLSTTLNLEPVPDWQPQITVSAVNSTTLVVTVTQAIGVGEALHMQILPSHRPTDMVKALDGVMTAVGNDTYVQTFQFPLTVFNGHVRVWVPGSDPVRETITTFFLSLGWNGDQFRAFGGNAFVGWDGDQFRAFSGDQWRAFGGDQFRAFGANMNSWSAPTSSADGQVILFNTDNILLGNVAVALQALDVPPNLAEHPWLTPVGQAYRYQTAEVESSPLVIQFLYLERELPFIQEQDLRIYYSPDEGETWQRIEQTEIDDFRNLASARMMKDPGIYALMATIATPPLGLGWNTWAYPQTDQRSVVDALASINDDYTSVYHYDGNRSPQWLLHDRTTRPEFWWFVNDLRILEPQQVYWIYALTETTPYIGVPGNPGGRSADGGLQLPPATFYGWISPTATFSPQIGDPVIALIDGDVCGTGTVERYNFGSPDVGPYQLFLPFTPSPGGIYANRLIYKVQVRADIGDGCGVRGRTITFKVGDQMMPNNHPWDNSQACYHPLGVENQEPSQCFLTSIPDLVVQQMVATANDVQLVIKNQGTAAILPGNDFWVDVYINPNPVPTATNQIWQNIALEGLVWGVIIPPTSFAPGNTLTLTVGDAFFWPTESNFSGFLPPGTPIYAQVDSAHAYTTFGAVLEHHEISGEVYNNILGPVLSLPGTDLMTGLDDMADVNHNSHNLPTR